jgi:glycosyltransferase involved in cell wall biosynthesis
VREKFNCHKATARTILDDAYGRLGLPPAHTLTDASIAKEREELELADFVFSPSPLCAASLRDNGVPEAKIIPSSYGYDPARVQGTGRSLGPGGGITVAFVGALCVRKGAHLLLRAWARAGIRGRLLLAGGIEPAIAAHCADLLNRADVRHLGHVADIGRVYRSADMLAFPSLEETGPLVTYEAMSCGLPVLVSPMGGGAVVRPGEDGIVRDPFDEEAWVDALRELAEKPDERERWGAAARMRVADFTWGHVGARRREALLERARPTRAG